MNITLFHILVYYNLYYQDVEFELIYNVISDEGAPCFSTSIIQIPITDSKTSYHFGFLIKIFRDSIPNIF